jgi:hypothetical protein
MGERNECLQIFTQAKCWNEGERTGTKENCIKTKTLHSYHIAALAACFRCPSTPIWSNSPLTEYFFIRTI